MRWLICFIWMAGVVHGATKTTPVATPTIFPAPGTYGQGVFVTFKDSTPGAVIHYTTDGSKANENSSVYTEHILIRATAKVRAIAIASGHSPSKEFVGNYEIERLLDLLGAG
jgi:hypothetical protein